MAAELLLGEPLFPGDSGVDQLVEIIKVRKGEKEAVLYLYHGITEVILSRVDLNKKPVVSSHLRVCDSHPKLSCVLCQH